MTETSRARSEASWSSSRHSYARAMVLARPVMNLLPVLIGVRADGRKELVAIGGWLPALGGFLGGGAARSQAARHASAGAGGRGRRTSASGAPCARSLRKPRHRNVGCTRSRNCLDALPKSLQPKPKPALPETEYINKGIIPALCRKAGIPMSGARGRITSHRARSTIATHLYNAKDPRSLFELQVWLGHRSPATYQHYAAITPRRSPALTPTPATSHATCRPSACSSTAMPSGPAQWPRASRGSS